RKNNSEIRKFRGWVGRPQGWKRRGFRGRNMKLKSIVAALFGVGLLAAAANAQAPHKADQVPVLAPAPVAPTAHDLTPADAEAWLDGLVPNALNTGHVPGAVVVLVKNGQVLMEKGYGFSDYEKRTPVDPKTTLFRPGSTSKLFTWTAVMQLVEAGKLNLDA